MPQCGYIKHPYWASDKPGVWAVSCLWIKVSSGTSIVSRGLIQTCPPPGLDTRLVLVYISSCMGDLSMHDCHSDIVGWMSKPQAWDQRLTHCQTDIEQVKKNPPTALLYTTTAQRTIWLANGPWTSLFCVPPHDKYIQSGAEMSLAQTNHLLIAKHRGRSFKRNPLELSNKNHASSIT